MQDIRYLVFSAPEVQDALIVLLRNRDPSLILGNAQCSLTGVAGDVQAHFHSPPAGLNGGR